MRKLKRIPNWYFTGAISSGDRSFAQNYELVVRVLKEFGRVPSEHVASSDSLAFEAGQKRQGVNVHARDFKGLDSSIALVADISLPTTGGGAEIDYAVRAGVPTLLVYDANKRGSWFLTQWPQVNGAPPNLAVKAYSSSSQLENLVRDFAQQVLQDNPPLPGAYLIVEGGEGCGKTKQRELLGVHLREQGFDVVEGREPGLTRSAEAIRNILLHPDYKGALGQLAELFLFEAARAEIFEQVIIPVMRSGGIMLSDRSYFSTIAYQGFGRGMGLATIDLLNHKATGGVKPDLAIVIDVDPKVGLGRMTTAEFGKADRFEQEKLDFHNRVRQGYLCAAEREPNVVVLPYVDGIDNMQSEVRKVADKFLTENFVEEK